MQTKPQQTQNPIPASQSQLKQPTREQGMKNQTGTNRMIPRDSAYTRRYPA